MARYGMVADFNIRDFVKIEVDEERREGARAEESNLVNLKLVKPKTDQCLSSKQCPQHFSQLHPCHTCAMQHLSQLHTRHTCAVLLSLSSRHTWKVVTVDPLAALMTPAPPAFDRLDADFVEVQRHVWRGTSKGHSLRLGVMMGGAWSSVMIYHHVRRLAHATSVSVVPDADGAPLPTIALTPLDALQWSLPRETAARTVTERLRQHHSGCLRSERGGVLEVRTNTSTRINVQKINRLKRRR